MSEKFIVVVYDISSDKRRTKLHNILLNYGTPVQYSVFECLLNEREEKQMRQAVKKVIRPRKDHVRFYTLCANCQNKVETTGHREILGPPPPAIIIGDEDGDDRGG
ncbi:MAG: CRISPR-associated endonuclease Cas2 [Chloroflexi bacterium]|nr:MAG: CRISPR-associated endonuclease Cas2 [Chloroflexota bacterium]